MIKLQVGNKVATINGDNKEIDVPPTIINNSAYVPTRVVAEAFGQHISWNQDNQTINISENPIIEWRYEGYESTEPYKEYEVKYVDGVTVLTHQNY